MACSADRGAKSACYFIRKLAYFGLKIEWFLDSKTGSFCRGKQGFSKSKYGDCNGSGFAQRPVEVGDEVISIFDAYCKPEQRVGNP